MKNGPFKSLRHPVSRRQLQRATVSARMMQERWFSVVAVLLNREPGKTLRITDVMVKSTDLVDREIDVHQDPLTGDMILTLQEKTP